CLETGNHAQQGRLAAPRRPEQGVKGAALDVQRYIIDCCGRTETLRRPGDLQHSHLGKPIVIPAKAGIQCPRCPAVPLDPRLRGGDGGKSGYSGTLRRGGSTAGFEAGPGTGSGPLVGGGRREIDVEPAADVLRRVDRW